MAEKVFGYYIRIFQKTEVHDFQEVLVITD